MCRRGNDYNMPALHLGNLRSCLASGGRLEIDGGNPYSAGEVGYTDIYTSSYSGANSIRCCGYTGQLTHVYVSMCVNLPQGTSHLLQSALWVNM